MSSTGLLSVAVSTGPRLVECRCGAVDGRGRTCRQLLARVAPSLDGQAELWCARCRAPRLVTFHSAAGKDRT